MAYGELEKGIMYIDTIKLKNACRGERALDRYNLFMSMVPSAQQHAAFLNHTIPNPISIDFDTMYEIVKDLTASSLNQIKSNLSTYIAERLDASNKHHADYLVAILLQNIALLGQDNSNPTHSKNILLHAVIHGSSSIALFQTGGDPESILKTWWEWITSKTHHLLPAYFVKQDTTESFINDNKWFDFDYKEKLIESLTANPLTLSYISWYVKQQDQIHTAIEHLWSSSIFRKYLSIPSAAFDTRKNILDTTLLLQDQTQSLEEAQVTPLGYLTYRTEIQVCKEKIDELKDKNLLNDEEQQQLKANINMKNSYYQIETIDGVETISTNPKVRPLKSVLEDCGFELIVTFFMGKQIYKLKPVGHMLNQMAKYTTQDIKSRHIIFKAYLPKKDSIYKNINHELSYLLWHVMKKHTLTFATIYVEQKTVREGKLYFVCHKDTKLENNFNPDQYVSNPNDNYLCFQALQPRQCKLHEIKE